MSDVVISVDGLSKKYHIGVTHQDNSLRATLRNKVRGLVRSESSSDGASDASVFWALQDVGFEVKRGEVMGIIGHNGAGKSTLLKILSRIVEPTRGRVEIHGRVGSLLEVGTGFHPELTGRENIYLNGAILGMPRAEIERKFDEIVAFAEVDRFIDTPVKRYSSGMYVRLAFAVAAHLEPEILIIDEVLAVGDIAFQRKCLGKMGDVAREGRTILFVSHNTQAIRTLCQRGVLLSHGTMLYDGEINSTLTEYNEQIRQKEMSADSHVGNEQLRRGTGAARFTTIEIQNKAGEECNAFRMKDTIRFSMSFAIFEPIDELLISVELRTSHAGVVVTNTTHTYSSTPLAPGHTDTVVIELPNSNIRPGEYSVYYWMGDALFRPIDMINGVLLPLVIFTEKSVQELGYDPAHPNGFYDIESRMILQPELQAETERTDR
jgi:lipopolysaccharide transport system ATP-binding protein